MACGVEQPVDPHPQYLVEVLIQDVLDVAVAAAWSSYVGGRSVVDDRGDRAVAVDCGRHRGLHMLVIGDTPVGERDSQSCGPPRLFEGSAFVLAAAGENDSRTLLRQSFDDGCADAVGGAGNQGHLAVESHSGTTSWVDAAVGGVVQDFGSLIETQRSR